MKKIYLILFYVITITNSELSAQTVNTNYFVPNLFPRSPTTTAIEKYGTYQVNEFTGVPNISIPLYTITSGKLTIPITLSYHASGIKVTDVASWAGLGWSVIAGGQISRRTMGLNDDSESYGYLSGIMKPAGTYSTNNVSDLQWLENIANGTYDTKPDIFSYDFPGHNGKFFFDGSSGNAFVTRMVPYSPIKISYASDNQYHRQIANFDVLDENGNDNKFNTYETTNSSSGGHSNPSMRSAWKLSTMISQDKHDTISITYNTQNILNPVADIEVLNVVDQIGQVNSNEGIRYSPDLPGSPVAIGNSLITTEQVPAQINFKNGKVIFELDPVVRADLSNNTIVKGLLDIQIFSFNYGTKSYDLQKKIMFHKSYFSPNLRLKLDSISITDGNGILIQRYRFNYNQSVQIPDYSSKSQDYWGYFNNKHNEFMIPRQSIPYTPNFGSSTINYVTINSGSDVDGRECDSTYMQAGVLTGIHYPTGGYSTFTYQTNQYTEYGISHLAGGLRVKSISSYDGVNPTPIVHTYQYNSNRKNFILDYAYFSNYQLHRYYDLSGNSGLPKKVADCVVRSFVSTPRCDLEAYDGATVVYPSVTEYIGTPGNNTGKINYLFQDRPDATSNASFAGNLIYLSAFHLRGQLVSKTDYKLKSDGTYQPVRAESHTYTAFPEVYYSNVGVTVAKLYMNDGSFSSPFPPNGAYPDDSNNYRWQTYPISSDDNYLTSTTINDYDLNDPSRYTTSTTTYGFGNIAHQQPTIITHTDNQGGQTTAKIKYPADYLLTPIYTTTYNAGLDGLLNSNAQAIPIEKYVNYSNAVTGVNGITSGELHTYTMSKGNGLAALPDKVNTLKVAASLINFAPSTVNSSTGQIQSDSRYIQTINFDDYDSQNNLTKYTPRNATATKILWDYNSSQPVAKFQNLPASTQSGNVAYTSFETGNYGNWNITGVPASPGFVPTGKLAYPMFNANITSPILDSSQPYVVTYWSNVSAVSVSGITATALKSVNGWTLYQHLIPAGTSQITLSGSGYIDELRLYPAVSQVTTYTYDPLVGVTSMTDPKGMTTYYEYDNFQRLMNVKDKDGNIVKHNEYHYVNQ